MEIDRRGVLLGVAGVGAGAALAACSSDKPSASSSQSTTTTATTSASGSAPPPGGVAAGNVPVGGGFVSKDQDFVITQPQADEYKAFSATCTHKGCTVATVSDGTINCPCHGSKYSITDGAVVAGPATKPLPPKSVAVTGDTLTVS